MSHQLFAGILTLLIVLIGCGDIADDNPGRIHAEPYTPGLNSSTSTAPTLIRERHADGAEAIPAGCVTAIQVPYAPFTSETFTQFPDDVFTIADEESETGRRVSITDEFAWKATVPEAAPQLANDLNSLNGFALSGEVFFEFDTQVTEPDSTAQPNHDAITFLRLSDNQTIPFEARYGLQGYGVLIRPLFPLSPGTQHAVIISTNILGTENQCVVTSPSITERLADDHPEPRLGDLAPAYRKALSGAKLPKEKIAGITVFTTHNDTGPMKDAAAKIASQHFQWSEGASCQVEEHYRKCLVYYEANDYRGPNQIVTSEPAANWTLPVAIWLPLEGDGPFPVIIYGHGINSGRHEGDYFARHFSDLGYAIVATDSLRHGDHPTRDPANRDLTALDILGVDLGELQINAFDLRSNFNQTILDRLQLLQLIKTQPDFDRDGIDDLDPQTIVYFGVSLGGMLGSGFSALADGLDAVVLSIAGGHLVKFVTDMEAIRMVRPLLGTLFGNLRNFERSLTIAQSAVDAADPVTYAPWILSNDRAAKKSVPSLMMPVSIFDSTVPPSTGKALARAIGLPHLKPVAETVLGLTVQETPARNNGADGTYTFGYFQFDRISKGNGDIELSDHASTPKSPEGRLQVRHFLQSVLDGKGVEIVDPYQELNTPSLPESVEGG